MAKRRLTPKCEDMLYMVVERAERQIHEAYPLLKAKGLTHNYYTRGNDGKQKEWRDCISSHAVVIRYDESTGRFVSHDRGERWHDLCHEDARSLCECADFLLRKAYGTE